MEFTLFCRKICFAAIYAVLLRNLFCRGLRTFCVETNHGQNVVRGEKMTYIMYVFTRNVVFQTTKKTTTETKDNDKKDNDNIGKSIGFKGFKKNLSCHFSG